MREDGKNCAETLYIWISDPKLTSFSDFAGGGAGDGDDDQV